MWAVIPHRLLQQHQNSRTRFAVRTRNTCPTLCWIFSFISLWVSPSLSLIFGLGVKTTTVYFLKPVFGDWLQPTRTCSRRVSPAGGERDLWVEVGGWPDALRHGTARVFIISVCPSPRSLFSLEHFACCPLPTLKQCGTSRR